jgi:hypothetical protein
VSQERYVRACTFCLKPLVDDDSPFGAHCPEGHELSTRDHSWGWFIVDTKRHRMLLWRFA